jgi:hypothetical protein
MSTPVEPIVIRRSKQQVRKRNNLAGIQLEMDWNGDNLIIALCSYFEGHMNCPDEEPDDENGWKPWAVQKAYEALDMIVDEVETSDVFRVG